MPVLLQSNNNLAQRARTRLYHVRICEVSSVAWMTILAMGIIPRVTMDTRYAMNSAAARRMRHEARVRPND